MPRTRLRLSLIVVAVAAMPLAAQKNGAWFGTPVPPPLGDPRKPIMKYDDEFAPLPVKFAHRPGRHDELLDGAALKADHEWTVNEFKTAGLKDARVETFEVPGGMWVPQSWKVELVGDPAFGPGTQSVTLRSAFPQPGGATISGGSLTAPVIFVGHGTDADLAGRDALRFSARGPKNQAHSAARVLVGALPLRRYRD